MAAKPTGYSLWNYGQMVNCEPRMSAYVEALRNAVFPGCTVFDLGSGPGIFAVLACKFGAAAAVCIDSDETVVLAERFAKANGCADKISIFQGLSTDFSPEDRADIIISDLHGALPYFEEHIPAIIDARERLLAPGGILIPSRDTLSIALVQRQDFDSEMAQPWLDNKFGLDLGDGQLFVANFPRKTRLTKKELLSDIKQLAVLDYYRIDTPDLSAKAELTVTRTGSAHGLAVWFDLELAPGIEFSNAPGEPEQVYGQMLFPLEKAVEVSPGWLLDAQVDARLIGGEYVWSWSVDIRDPGSNSIARFRQSSFQARIMSPQSLRTQASDFSPPIREWHEVDRFCLSHINGERTLGSIADAAFAEFPKHFGTRKDALDYVAKLTTRYE